jgi:DNA invertase Pin-like site-specific DNA recombinase
VAPAACPIKYSSENVPVTFVSVTQSFNTTTSMGRLTLNVLLSFAQFEREVIDERIRDKFAASRKRGMWMGGWAPLGYEVRERKLPVNEADAKLVRSIFQRFLKTGSATTFRDAAQWPAAQTEIHFHLSSRRHRAVASEIIRRYQL